MVQTKFGEFNTAAWGRPRKELNSNEYILLYGILSLHDFSLRLQPSQEETKLCKSYTGDRYQLQPADNFLFELCEVPMLSTRLDLLYTIREFPANLDSFEPVSERSLFSYFFMPTQSCSRPTLTELYVLICSLLRFWTWLGEPAMS